MVNQWDKTPWMMGGGARHSANVGRLLAYAAFNGDEGIIGSADLSVRQKPVASGVVQILPGACSILNRGLNVNYEAYASRLPILDEVAISPTGSAGIGRSDLIVAVVMNPFQDGEPWPDPAPEDIASGAAEFVKTMVIPNVPATTKTVRSLNLGYSAIALARIDIPPNTGAITQAMIKDVRQMSQVREKTVEHSWRVAGTQYVDSGAFRKWPVESDFLIDIPEWATHCSLTASTSLVVGAGGGGNNSIDLALDVREVGAATPPLLVYATQNFDKQVTADQDRLSVSWGRVQDVLPEWRGTSKMVAIWARQAAAHNASSPAVGSGWDSGWIRITFQQRPVLAL